MRWATFRTRESAQERVGLVAGDELRALPAGVALIDLLDDGLARAGEQARKAPADVHALRDVTLLAPIPRPPSMRDFMAFEAHYANVQRALQRPMPNEWYEMPVFYFSNPAAIVGPSADVAMSPGTRSWDYELEVGAIIGRPGRDLDPNEAERHIAGYCVLCDFSARDHQAREMNVGLGPTKAKDTATSLGPFLVTPDELAPYRRERAFDLAMKASVNGRPYSSGRMSELSWSFGEMLAFASRGTELRTGDVIGSGTVGTGCILELLLMHGAEQYPWLKAGDEVELTIEQLGTLRHRITAGAVPIPLPARARS